MTASPAEVPSRRVRALDGLRGWAAIVVLAHHSMLTLPSFSAVQYGSQAHGRWAEAVAYSPLHLLWAGPEAVIVFFVLSGYALMESQRDRLGRRTFWRRYYLQRVCRLWIPLAAGVALAAIVVQASTDLSVPPGRWLTMRSQEVSAGRVVEDLTLLFGHSGLLSPLWSLRWELWFSLLLPLYVYAANHISGTRASALTGGLLIAVSVMGTWVASPALRFMPVFMLGVLVSNRLRHRKPPAAGGPPRQRTWLVVCLLGLTSPWLVRPTGWTTGAEAVTHGFVTASAVGLVWMAIYWPALRRALEHRLSLWLGSISFSLYLVHEPVVVVVARLSGEPAAWTLIVGGVSSIIAAVVFFRIVERPSHRLARMFDTRSAASPNRGNEILTASIPSTRL